MAMLGSEGGSEIGEVDRSSGQQQQRQRLKTCLWGTTVDVEETRAQLKGFLESTPEIVQAIRNCLLTRQPELPIDTARMRAYSPELYSRLEQYPMELIALLDEAVQALAEQLEQQELRERGRQEQDDAAAAATRLHLTPQPFGLARVAQLRQLDPGHVDQLVALRGLVIRLSPLLPHMTQAVFACAICGAEEAVYAQENRVQEPQVCAKCRTRYSMRLLHNRCEFLDKQLVKLQETPEAIPEGETPQTLTAVLYDRLVDGCQPGDRVELTGILRAAPVRLNPRHRHLRTLYRTYLDVLHVRRLDSRRRDAERPAMDARHAEDAEDEAEEEEEDEGDEESGDEAAARPVRAPAWMRELARRGDVYTVLARSVAPSVHEHEDLKRGLLLLLMGGAAAGRGGGGARTRGELHVLLVGDPGTSKSQLLQYVHRLAPRGIYTSGRGSSAVGLTAYVTRDPDSRQPVLESGALVLSDRGVCCIDEFDKMPETTRAVLHEVMEQQSVSVAKAGIVASLNARTSILASANPRESRYNARLPVVENLSLPPTLLSRFDLIYLVLDRPAPDQDRRLARHLVRLYSRERPAPDRELLPPERLAQYVHAARRCCRPRLTDEAAAELERAYLDLRRAGLQRRTVAATPRQLQSLIRLAEAHARIRLSRRVEHLDVDEALRLMRAALLQAATDPRTGTIDLDLLTTGRSAAARHRAQDIARGLRAFLEQAPESLPSRLDELHRRFQAAINKDLPLQDLRDALKLLEQDDFLVLLPPPANPLVRLR